MSVLPQNPPKTWTWDAADALLREHGGAFYLLDLDLFSQNCRAFRAEFCNIYPHSSLGYSYKTNYTPAICRRADELGCYAEVVSRMELELALQLGVPGERIIFNGPVKSHDDLALAVQVGAMIHVDNAEEWNTLSHIVPSSSKSVRVAIRCNFPLKADHRSRFGFDATGRAVHELAGQMARTRNCRFVGLHCHFSHHRDAASYRTRAQRLVALARELSTDEPLEYIDIGGGYCGNMPDELRGQFANPVPTYREYAQAIAPVVADAFGIDGPELILEPGMGVVADCMKFITAVTSVKIIQGRRYAVTPGTVYNVKPTMNAMNLPLEILSNSQAQGRTDSGETDVVGATCMEVDIMYRGLAKSVDVGDILIFGNVGAYTTVLLPPFIRPAPAILACDDGKIRLVRRAQTTDDVLATYVV